jgi:hypothetical protein
MNGGLDGFHRRYRRALRGMSARLLLKSLKCPLIHHPILRQAVMRLGLASMRGPANHVRPALLSPRLGDVL